MCRTCSEAASGADKGSCAENDEQFAAESRAGLREHGGVAENSLPV